MRRPGARRISPALSVISPVMARSSVVLPEPLAPARPSLRPLVSVTLTPRRISRSSKGYGGILDFDETFGLAAGGVEGDAGRGDSRAGFGVAQLGDKGVGVVDAGFGFGGAGLRAAAEPFHLYADAVAQALLGALLPLDVGVAVFEKFGIATFYAQQAVGVNAVELDDLGSDVLKEVTVVGDDDKGKTGSTEQAFKPFDAVKIEVVRGLIEKKDLGIGDKSFSDGEPLAPAAA